MDLISSQRRPPIWIIFYQSLIWNQPLSNIIQYLFLGLANIHCIFILFFFQFQFIIKKDQSSLLIQSLKRISQSLVLKEVADFHSDNQIIIAVISMTFIYFLSFVSLHLTNVWDYSQNKKLNSWKKVLSIIFAQFHLAIGFWTINAFLMDYIHVSKSRDSSLFALSVLLIVFNYIFAAFFSLYSYDPFLSSNILSSYTPAYQVLTTLFKAIVAPFIFFSSPESSLAKWSFVSISLVILTTRQYHLQSRFSYYKYTTMMFCLILSTISCLLIFLIFIALSISSKTIFSSQTLVFTQLLLIPFVVYAAIESFKKTTFQYISKKNSELKTPEDVIKKIFAVLSITKKTQFNVSEDAHKNINEIGFWNLLKTHGYLHHDESSSNSVIPYQVYNKFINEIIENLLDQMIQKFRKNINLRLLQIDFGLQLNKHIEVLIFYLGELTRLSGKNQFLSHQLYYKLQENMNRFLAENKEEILDIQQYIEQESYSEAFTEAIKENTKDYLQFWNEYLFETQVKVKKLFNQSKKLEKGADFIENLWNKHSETNKHFALSLYTIYRPYLQLLKAAPFQAYKLAQKYASHKQEEIYRANEDGFNEESLTDPNVVCLHTDMNKEDPGRCLKVTSNIIDQAGWFPQELINQNINILMPEFMAIDHQKILFGHLKNLSANEKPKRMHQTLATFILHQSGYLVPCDIYLTFHPYVQENPVYVAFMKIKQTNVEKIFLSNAGEVQGWTKDIGQLLGLAKGNIDSICSNSQEIKNIMKNLIYQNTTPSEIFAYFQHPENDQVQFTFLVELSLHYYYKKPYYILSLAQDQPQIEQTLQQIRTNPKLNPSSVIQTLPPLSPNTDPNQSDIYLSEIFEEIPKNSPTNNPIPIKSPNKRKSNVFSLFDTQKLNTQFLTNENGVLHTGESLFILENLNQSKAFVTSQRSLLGLSPRSNTKEEEDMARKSPRIKRPGSLIKTPTYADSTMKRFKTRLELSLQVIPKIPFLSFLFFCMILFLIISCIPLIIFQTRASETFSFVHSSSETISSSIIRLAEFTDLNANVRVMWLNQLGILLSDRWNILGYTDSAIDLIFWYIPFMIANIKNGNDAVRSSVYQLDSKLKKQIYEGKVPVYEMQNDGTIGSTRRDTLFDLTTELVSQGTKFCNSDLPFNSSNPYLLFVLNNTMNDPLVLGETEVSILLENNTLKLNDLTSFLYYMMGLIALLAVAILIFFSYIVNLFMTQRNHFLEIFAILDEKTIMEHLETVEEFRDCLIFDFTKIRKRKVQARANAIKRRKIDTRGIHKTLILLFVSFLMFLVLLFSVYPILYSQVGPGNKDILGKMNLMAQSNWNLFDTVFAFNILYYYVQEPNGYVKNQPITTVFEASYQKLTKVQDFILNDLLNPENGMNSDPVLYQTAVGNLCELYHFDDPIVTSKCDTIGAGFLTKGVSGMNSFLTSFLRTIYVGFKYSDQGIEAARETWQNEGAIIWEAFYPFIYTSYLMIDELIRNAMTKNFDRMTNRVTSVMVAYILIYAIIGVYSAWKIKTSLEKEITDWRKMLRRIPYTVATENQHLKAFLNRTTGLLSK